MKNAVLVMTLSASVLVTFKPAQAGVIACDSLVSYINSYIAKPIDNRIYYAMGTVAVMEPGRSYSTINDTDDKAIGLIYYNEEFAKTDGDGILLDTGVADRNSIPGLTGVAWEEPSQKLSLRFRLGPDGHVTYQKTLNGISIGNAPPVHGQATCTSDGQVTGILSSTGDQTKGAVRTFIASFRFAPWGYVTN